MNKSQLVEAIATKNNLSKAQAGAVLETVLETITGSLKKGAPVVLVGFGTFKVTKRKARTGINPRTKEAIKIPAAKVPKFTAGATLKGAVAKAK